MDLDAVEVGNGNFEAGRGIPLGLIRGFCCRSISTLIWQQWLIA